MWASLRGDISTQLIHLQPFGPFGHQPPCGISCKIAQSSAVRSAPVCPLGMIFCIMTIPDHRSISEFSNLRERTTIQAAAGPPGLTDSSDPA
jgi:hypothetical protein